MLTHTNRVMGMAMVAVLAIAAVAARQDDDGRGVVGILRRDGIVLPIASFRGGSWSMSWPVGLQNQDIPITLDAVPRRWWGGREPEGWRGWLTSGEVRPLSIEAPVVLPIHCDRRLGLRTTYKSSEPAPPPGVEPYPKDGLAVSGGSRIEPIEVLDTSSPQWAQLAAQLVPSFIEAEDSVVVSIRRGSGWRHPVADDVRRETAVKLESWYRTMLDEPGTSVSYVEAVRTYAPGPEDDGCGLVTFFNGWVFHDERRPKPSVDMTARVMYCDRAGASYMLPLGRLRLRDRLHWIYQMSSFDGEWYRIVRVEDRRILILAEYFGGSRLSCPGFGDVR